MMILSRIWYVILAILLAAAYYVVALAVGQYNRRNTSAMQETVKADAQVVSWQLQIDARRRLDNLFLASGDATTVKAVKAANGKDQISPGARDDGAKALHAFNEKLPPEQKNDVLFLADREGRLVSQVGFDQVNGFPEFELGGYPAVFDALHGFLRDDIWVWGGKIARVVARPVEDDVGLAPLGAVVAIRWVDPSFAKDLSKRTRTNIAFFALGTRVASAAGTENFDESSLEALSDFKTVADDKAFKETGHTDVRDLADDKGGVIFSRLTGEAADLGAGFAVARPKVSISSLTGFITGADDTDKKNVKIGVILAIALGAAFLGILFTYLEHSMPLNRLVKEAEKLKRGETDVLQLPRFRGAYRAAAADINAGIQRVVEKGGGTARKPADLESILGPVPAQPNMSAFSFPLNNDGSVAQQIPHVPPGPPGNFAGPNPGMAGMGPPGPPPPNARFPGAPPPPNSRPQVGPNGLGPPGPPPPYSSERTMAMNNMPPPPSAGGGYPPPPQPAAGMAPGAHSATIAATPAAAKLVTPGTQPAPFPPGSKKLPAKDQDQDEQTMVAQPSADLINAATGANLALDPTAEWHQVYEEFLRTKRECGEPTDGLTFEKFQQTLKKNRDALMQRHGCKRVKFSVYVKEGRASLKATPVRD